MSQVQPLSNYLTRDTGFIERANLMRTFQDLFTESVLAYCQKQAQALDCPELALGGGCALNLPANSAVRRSVGGRLTIPPNCNDSGQALGAALYTLKIYLGITPEPYGIFHCGQPLNEASIVTALGRTELRTASLDIQLLVSYLSEGAVVAFSHGTSELGPRALGNRSLIASACKPWMRTRISEGLKGRQWYRPLACVMREEQFRQVYPREPPSPHMLFHYPMKDGLAPEATHADGTGRIQTLTHDANPILWDILREHERQTGELTLLNTSLNGPGKAIAYDADDVLDDFLSRDVDVFVFNHIMAFRK